MMATGPDKSLLYHPRMPLTWWLRKRNYFLFILRELTSVFSAIFLVLFLVHLYHLGNGAGAYAAFAEKLKSPGWIVFHVVALVFAIYHSVTWFVATATIMPVRLGGRELPRGLVTAGAIGGWIVVSFIILVIHFSLAG